jgi:hypothetical protein
MYLSREAHHHVGLSLHNRNRRFVRHATDIRSLNI